MKRNFLAITLLMISTFELLAENKPGFVRTDGKAVIVRAKASEASESLFTFNDGDFFYCEPATDSLWMKISIFPREYATTEGYIPRINVRLIEALIPAQKKELITKILTTHQSLAEEFRRSVHETPEKHKVAREKLEYHNNVKYMYALDITPSYLHSTGDGSILKLLFGTVYADRGSAGEFPGIVLARCLVDKPELTMSLIEEIADKEERVHIIRKMEFGLLNYYDQQKGDLEQQRNSLQEKLQKLIAE